MIPRGHNLIRVHLCSGVTGESGEQEIRVEFRNGAEFAINLSGVVGRRLLNGRRGVDQQQTLFITDGPLFQGVLKHAEEEAFFFRRGLNGLRGQANSFDFGQFRPFFLRGQPNARVDRSEDAGSRLTDVLFSLRFLRRQALARRGRFLGGLGRAVALVRGRGRRRRSG